MQRKTCHSSKNVKSETKTKKQNKNQDQIQNLLILAEESVLGLSGLKEIFIVSRASIM